MNRRRQERTGLRLDSWRQRFGFNNRGQETEEDRGLVWTTEDGGLVWMDKVEFIWRLGHDEAATPPLAPAVQLHLSTTAPSQSCSKCR